MDTFAVYLRPRGSLASTISSDTLFGAICWGIQMLQLEADVGSWLKGQNAPPFAFSSAFPAWFDADRKPLLRCYPRPETFTLSISSAEKLVTSYQRQKRCGIKEARKNVVELLKPFARIKYVSENVLLKIVQGSLTPLNAVESLLLGDGETILEGEILFTKKERDAFARIGEVKRLPSQVPVQHNQIDRVSGSTGEGMLFYQNEVFFQHGAGLWSMLRTSQAIFNSYIRPALRYLADTGLGAKRTSGKGHFYISYETMAALPASSKANGVLMLSRFLPAKDELINPEKHPLAYKLVTLRPKREQHIPAQVVGRATPPIYKRAVRAFEPGSVFPLTMRREIYGRLEELVTPAEGGPVLQGGFALPVFLWVEEEHDGK